MKKKNHYAIVYFKKEMRLLKKVLLIVSIYLLTFVFISCETDNDNYKINAIDDGISIFLIKQTLEDDGYHFDYFTGDTAITRTTQINTDYSINIQVTDIFTGYKTGNLAWVDILNFAELDEAGVYVNAIITQDTTGLLYYQSGDTVVITYTQAAKDLLDAIPQP